MPKQLPAKIFVKWNTDDDEYQWLEASDKMIDIVDKNLVIVGEYRLVEKQEAKLIVTSKIHSKKVR